MSRLDGIDILRGLSILAVILLHIWIRFAGAHVRLGRDWPVYTRHFLFQNGGNGVTTFFAVSGFLITLTSLRRFGSLDAIRARVFYRIRFARIMPLLLLMLCVLTALHLLHVDGYVINEKFFTLPRALFAALTFHLNWLEASRNAWLPACWTVLWSLSIEEMFYLFFPLISLVLFRGGSVGRWMWIALAVALFALGPLARVVWAKNDLQAENSYLAGMASIALGCLTAYVVDRLSPREIRSAWLRVIEIAGWAGILLIAVSPRGTIMRTLGKSGTDDALLALSVCLVMAAVTLRRKRGSRWSAPLRWFGRHSYELYLSHEFIVIFGVALFAQHFPNHVRRGVVAAFVIGMLLATAPLAWALARSFTEPANRWLRGAEMAKTSGAPAPSVDKGALVSS
ncbi:MAG TPA: acyltransferase [Acidobacteriaceae bacterium]|nr:acyltransferase [Acidobacteriaceae bacterium]